MTEHRPFDFYAASCTDDGGIYRIGVHEGRMKITDFFACPNPMYMTIQADKMTVLLRNPYQNSSESGVFEYRIARDGSLVEPTETQGTGGIVACHVAVEGSDTYIANYVDGSIYHVGGRLVCHYGNGVNPDRQESAHCHCVCPTPDGKYILCADLGTDTVYTYDRQLGEVSRAGVPYGEGCRHLVCSQDGRYVFCANELGCTVTVFSMTDGRLTRLDTYDTVKRKDASVTVAAIRLSEDGRYLYVSNRGENTVALFSVSGEKLTYIDSYSTVDSEPRDFTLLCSGKWAAAANQSMGSVVLYRVEDGRLIYSDKIKLPQALCIVER